MAARAAAIPDSSAQDVPEDESGSLVIAASPQAIQHRPATLSNREVAAIVTPDVFTLAPLKKCRIETDRVAVCMTISGIAFKLSEFDLRSEKCAITRLWFRPKVENSHPSERESTKT
jgi:hypothetical protein